MDMVLLQRYGRLCPGVPSLLRYGVLAEILRCCMGMAILLRYGAVAKMAFLLHGYGVVRWVLHCCRGGVVADTTLFQS